MTPEQEAVTSWLYAQGYYSYATAAKNAFAAGLNWHGPDTPLRDETFLSLLAKSFAETAHAKTSPFAFMTEAQRLKKWKTVWRQMGDDMPCPVCNKEQIKTQDHLTVCLACGWSAKNGVAK